ncbi:unnamed protein product [Linum tenue]|nr:unnamed protein product [Linum tenue]
MLVHCRSKDNDLGVHYVRFNNKYEWGFKPNIWLRTLYWCYLAPSGGRYLNFDAYNSKIGERNRDFPIYWIAKEDGVYQRILDNDMRTRDVFQHPWKSGR